MHKPAPQLLSRHTTTYRLRDNFTGYEYIHDQPFILRMKHFALLFASTLLHLLAKILSPPDSTCSSVIMIARNHDDR